MNELVESTNERGQIAQIESQVRELTQQLEWFKRQLFGRKSEQRLLVDPAVQPLLIGLVEGD
ncbi:MAG: hypothetical protein HY943_10665 [Gammaproteobacteria bacterium]|nr:hypothetical protein [Gammaproteobacteria bacterium]